MSLEERGLYITLLCVQWNQGYVLEAEFIRYGSAIAQPSLSYVKSKFKLSPDGLYRNARMELVRAEQAEFRANRSKSGKAGADKRWHSDGSAIAQPWHSYSTAIAQPMANHMANDSSPSPTPTPYIDANTNKGANFPTLCEVKAYAGMTGVKAADAEAFWHHFESTGWIDKNGHPIVKWQSKLMTWKVKAAEMPVPGATRPVGVSASVEAIQRGKELEEVNKLISALRMGDHMELDEEDRKKLKELKTRQKELKSQLGWKV